MNFPTPSTRIQKQHIHGRGFLRSLFVSSQVYGINDIPVKKVPAPKLRTSSLAGIPEQCIDRWGFFLLYRLPSFNPITQAFHTVLNRGGQAFRICSKSSRCKIMYMLCRIKGCWTFFRVKRIGERWLDSFLYPFYIYCTCHKICKYLPARNTSRRSKRERERDITYTLLRVCPMTI